jgi:hypothetical protein
MSAVTDSVAWRRCVVVREGRYDEEAYMARSESHHVLRVKSREGSGVIFDDSSDVSLISLSSEAMNIRGGLWPYDSNN